MIGRLIYSWAFSLITCGAYAVETQPVEVLGFPAPFVITVSATIGEIRAPVHVTIAGLAQISPRDDPAQFLKAVAAICPPGTYVAVSIIEDHDAYAQGGRLRGFIFFDRESPAGMERTCLQIELLKQGYARQWDGVDGIPIELGKLFVSGELAAITVSAGFWGLLGLPD